MNINELTPLEQQHFATLVQNAEKNKAEAQRLIAEADAAQKAADLENEINKIKIYDISKKKTTLLPTTYHIRSQVIYLPSIGMLFSPTNEYLTNFICIFV